MHPTPRDTTLALGGEAFRRAGHELVDRIATFLDTLGEQSLTTAADPAAIRAVIDAGAPMPDQGSDPEVLLRETASHLMAHSLFNGHPQFYGYITSSPAPIGMLGDLLAAAINPNVGAWRLAPLATEIEKQAVQWIAELIGYPRDAGGLFVSGGNMANIVAFLAARVAAAGHDVHAEGAGAPGAAPLAIYASRETHTWLHKAASLSGVGTERIRWIAVDETGRLDLEDLRAHLARDRAAGVRPLMVIGTAGTVSTGVIDPLRDLAAICRDVGAWFHIDGAYGGFAAAVPGLDPDLAAIGEADSIAIDPHKWLYAPLEAGCVLVRDPAALRRTYSHHPVYYQFDAEQLNYFDYGPQNSRGFRALKVWLALKQVGRAGYAAMIAEDIRLARQLHVALEAHPAFEAATTSLSITTFRYVPADLVATVAEPATAEYLDALNRELVERIQASGRAFVSNAVVAGRYMLRACIVNFNTTAAHVEALPGIILPIARALDAEMRKG